MAKFKQGDKICMVEDKDYVVTVEKVTKNGYELSNRFKVYFKEESDWELTDNTRAEYHDINELEPHGVSCVECGVCGHQWVAVHLRGTDVSRLECPNCHQQGQTRYREVPQPLRAKAWNEAPNEPSTHTKEESVEEIMAEAKKLLKNCDQLDKELDAMKQGKEFLLHEYKTNKRWFRVEGGRVTVEDVIKACFEFGWASHRNHEYDQRATKDVKTMEVNEDTEREAIYGFINNAINIEDDEVYKITITKE